MVKKASTNPRYQALFGNYTSATDGKELIGFAVARLMVARGLHTVLDVGAGNGKLTARLAAEGLSVVAVEPNPQFTPALKKLWPLGVSAVRAHAQALPPSLGSFDAALLSYVFDSMSEEEIATACAEISKRVKPDGLCCGVTYDELSPWRSYSAAVEREIGPCLTGGRTRVFAALRGAGLAVRPLGIVRTSIRGDSLADLFNSTSFLYRRRYDAYHAATERLLPELFRFASSDNGNYRLMVHEMIFEWGCPSR